MSPASYRAAPPRVGSAIVCAKCAKDQISTLLTHAKRTVIACAIKKFTSYFAQRLHLQLLISIDLVRDHMQRNLPLQGLLVHRQVLA